MRTLKAAAAYFALVFLAGFVLGVIRTLWVVPWAGVRSAELLESPIMLVGTMVAARWTGPRLAEPPMPSVELGWAASHSSLCWLWNSGSCSGFVDCRTSNTLPRGQCREPEYYGDC